MRLAYNDAPSAGKLSLPRGAFYHSIASATIRYWATEVIYYTKMDGLMVLSSVIIFYYEFNMI
jgi:hypothetical protein